MYGDFFNRPLKKDVQYSVFVRAYTTGNKSTSSAYSQPMAVESIGPEEMPGEAEAVERQVDDSLMLIIVPLSACGAVVFILLIVLIIIFARYKLVLCCIDLHLFRVVIMATVLIWLLLIVCRRRVVVKKQPMACQEPLLRASNMHMQQQQQPQVIVEQHPMHPYDPVEMRRTHHQTPGMSLSEWCIVMDSGIVSMQILAGSCSIFRSNSRKL